MTAGGPAPVDVAVDYGRTLLAAGLVDDAEAVWRTAFEQVIDDGQSPATDALAALLAHLYVQQNRVADAMRVRQQSMVLQLRPLWRALLTRTQVEREKLLRRHRRQIDQLLTLLLPFFGQDAAAKTVLDLLLWRRGLGLEPYRAVNHAARRDPAIALELDTLRALRTATVVELFSHPLTPAGPGRTQFHQEGLRRTPEIDEREAAIFARLTEEDCAALHPPDSAAVAARLPADAAVVMYYRWRAVGAGNQLQSRYLALVLRSSPAAATTLVDLGEAAAIDDSVSAFHMALLRVPPDSTLPRQATRGFVPQAGRSEPPAAAWRSAGDALRALIVDPLRPALDGVSRLFVVPDGLLTRLSFATLPADAGFLLDRYAISYLATGRELCEEGTGRATAPVVVAAPDYNAHAADAPGADTAGEWTPTPLWFADLPGSRVEGDLVAARLKTTSVSGAAATTRALAACDSPIVLHISTHGTLLPVVPSVAEFDPRAPFEPGVETVGTVVFQNLGRLAGVEIEDQALRSMIAVTGVNTWLAGGDLPDAADTGWLNAEQIARMNLSGTQIVVLSACETGLGVVDIGEAVLGVRSAFAVAGARTVVSTLWQVQDAFVTPELMADFYDALADGATGSALALCHAQRAARLRYPDRPDWWGPFICHGTGGILPAAGVD